MADPYYFANSLGGLGYQGGNAEQNLLFQTQVPFL